VDLKALIEHIVDIGVLFNTEGICVQFMNSDYKNNVTDSSTVRHMINSITPSGRTPLGTELKKKIIKPYYAHTDALTHQKKKQGMLSIK